MASSPPASPRGRLETLANRIPDRYRLPTMLHCFHGMGTDEIARTLDVPVRAVRSRVAEGIHRLDRLMQTEETAGGTVRQALREAVREKGVIAPPRQINPRHLFAKASSPLAPTPNVTVKALLGDTLSESLWGGACRRLRTGLNRVVHALPATLL